METAGGVVCSATNQCSFVSGNIQIQIGNPSKSLKALSPKSMMAVGAPKTTKAVCGVNDVLGDMNLDCIFNIQDVSFTQNYFVGTPSVRNSVTADQVTKMDVTQNGGEPDAVDISYLLTVLGNKRRFLSVGSGPVSSTQDLVAFTVTIKDETGAAALPPTTTVKYEVGTSLNKKMVIVEGTAGANTTNGVIVTASHIGNGVYRAKFIGPFQQESAFRSRDFKFNWRFVSW